MGKIPNVSLWIMMPVVCEKKGKSGKQKKNQVKEHTHARLVGLCMSACMCVRTHMTLKLDPNAPKP